MRPAAFVTERSLRRGDLDSAAWSRGQQRQNQQEQSVCEVRARGSWISLAPRPKLRTEAEGHPCTATCPGRGVCTHRQLGTTVRVAQRSGRSNSITSSMGSGSTRVPSAVIDFAHFFQQRWLNGTHIVLTSSCSALQVAQRSRGAPLNVSKQRRSASP